MKPPRLARLLMRRAVPPDTAGLSVLGDLDEEFNERCRASGSWRARLWYWRQAISIWSWAATAHPPDSHHSPRGGVMFDIVGDLRHAIRIAKKTPGQTVLIVATLAIAIGVTTVGFALADTILLRGLPIADPDDTILVYGIDSRQPDRRGGVFFDDYLDIRERARTVEQLSAWSRSRSTVLRGDDAYIVTVSRVAGDLFGAWGLSVQRGRGLRVGDDAPGAPRVAVLADHYWRRVFGASPSVIGEIVIVDGVPHEIVGVLNPAIEFGTLADIGIWAPLPLERQPARDAQSVIVTGRLAANHTAAEAAAEIGAIARAIETDHAATNRGRSALVLPAKRAIGGPNFWIVMTLLIAAVTFVMAIASANVAGILLARGAARQREFGLRIALGARQSRVFRQLVAEGLLVAIAGGVGGLVAAEAGLRIIRSVQAEPIFQQIFIDQHEVLFVAMLAVATPLLFSLAPAVATTRVNLAGLLNAGGARSGTSRGSGRQSLVVAQLALAVTLVTIGGLVVRTASAISAAPTGFDTNGLLVFALSFDDRRHPEMPVRRQLVAEIENRLRRAGVDVSAGALDSWPAISIEPAAPIVVDAFASAEADPALWAHVVAVDSHALSTLGVPLLEGRALTESDVARDAPVALISAQAATRYFGGISAAIGRRLQTRLGGVTRERQIVGVTGDVRNVEPERGMPPRVWVPLAEPRNVAFVVRTGDLRALAGSVRQAVRDVAAATPIESLESYEQGIARVVGSDRIIMGMLVTFAGLALLFAATGLYGVVAYSVSQRRAEFGTRFALGARVSDVAGLVVRQAFKLLAAGLALGLSGGLAVANAMRGMLYGVTPLDPLNVGVVIAVLAAVTVAASLVPALRAARVDVVQAIRAE